jgi:hypothetical protein
MREWVRPRMPGLRHYLLSSSPCPPADLRAARLPTPNCIPTATSSPPVIRLLVPPDHPDILFDSLSGPSTHTAFSSTILSPSRTSTSSSPMLGLFTHRLIPFIVLASMLYSAYSAEGSPPAGNDFSLSSREERSGGVRWPGGGSCVAVVRRLVRDERVRWAKAG